MSSITYTVAMSNVHLGSVKCFPGSCYLTRFGPNRVAADMEGNGEFDFLEIFDDFWRISWRFLEIF